MTAHAPMISTEEARLLAHALNDWKAAGQTASPLISIFTAVLENHLAEDGDQSRAGRAAEREFVRQTTPDVHNDVLARHGLKLQHVPRAESFAGSAQSQIVLVVSDGDAFLRLLKALTPAQAGANKLGENLSSLLQLRIGQIQSAVLSAPGLFSSAEYADTPLLGAQFARLGFPIGEQASNTYLWATEGTLAVRIRTEQSGILSSQEAPFGPAKWHTDSTVKRYGEMWVKGIEAMQELWSARDLLEGLATQANSNLVEALSYARAELVRLKIEDPTRREELAGKLKVLVWAQAEVQGLDDEN